MTLPEELRAAAARQRDDLVRFNLELQAHRVDIAIRCLTIDATDDVLRTLQSEWAGARRLLSTYDQPKEAVR